MLDWIQNWYKSNCDGNWEHSRVIRIESLDNPGWNIEIDFNDTEIEIQDFPWKLFEISEDNWVGFSINNNVFKASGDPYKLNLMINIFKKIIDNHSIEESQIKSLMGKTPLFEE